MEFTKINKKEVYATFGQVAEVLPTITKKYIGLIFSPDENFAKATRAFLTPEQAERECLNALSNCISNNAEKVANRTYFVSNKRSLLFKYNKALSKSFVRTVFSAKAGKYDFRIYCENNSFSARVYLDNSMVHSTRTPNLATAAINLSKIDLP